MTVEILSYDESQIYPETIKYNGSRFRRIVREEFTIGLSKRPKCLDNRDKTKEVLIDFLNLMEESYEKDWDGELKMFHPNLDFWTLMKGLVRSFFQYEKINPETVGIMMEDVHPLAMFKYNDWYSHFNVSKDTKITEEHIADVFYNFLRYMKMIKIEDLYNAINQQRFTTYKTLGLPNVMNLPYYPALVYQKEKHGDLFVSDFIPRTGWFDGGIWKGDTECPACHTTDLIDWETYKVCPTCRLGLKNDGIEGSHTELN